MKALRHHICLILFILFSFTSQAAAEHALALHGAPKYSEKAKAFDYVNQQAPKGGELRLAVLGSFDHFSPYPVTSVGAEGIFLVFDSLLKRSLDEPFSCYGRIASKIIINKDESSVTFILNPEARFHNNQKITSKDIEATYQLIRKKGPFTLKQAFTKITKSELISPLEIKFTFAEKGQRQLALMIGFMPILSHKDLLNSEFKTMQELELIGNGPYQVHKSQKGKFIEYKRVKNYWAKDLPVNIGHYNFDLIKFEYFRNYETAFQAFKAREIDVFSEDDIGNWLKNYNFAATRRGDVQLKEIPRTNSGMKGFVFNTRKKFLSHKNVRKALSLMLDVSWLNKTYFHNAYTPIYSYFQHTDFEAPPHEIKLMDARKARHEATELLKKTGYIIKDNNLIDPQTQTPLQLEILIPTGPQERIALAYKKSLASLGLKITLRSVDYAQYQSRLSTYDYDLIFHGWPLILAPSEEQLNYWGSRAALTPGASNYAGITDPKIDSLLTKIVRERKTEKLKPLVIALDHHLREGYYVAPFLMKQRDTIAYWHKFGQPKIQPVSTFPLVRWWVTQTWWAQ